MTKRLDQVATGVAPEVAAMAVSASGSRLRGELIKDRLQLLVAPVCLVVARVASPARGPLCRVGLLSVQEAGYVQQKVSHLMSSTRSISPSPIVALASMMRATMSEIQVVDFHTHVHPTARGGLALQRRFQPGAPQRSGSLSEMLAWMAKIGVAKAMIVPWMPAQDLVGELVAKWKGDGKLTEADKLRKAQNLIVQRWRRLNKWGTEAVKAHPKKLMTLVGLDPILMGEALVRREAEERLATGAIGLKIAPLFLGCPPDDPRMEIVWRLADKYRVFVLAQSGKGGYQGRPAWGHPQHFEQVLRSYPHVKIQLAHLGMGHEDVMAKLTAKYPNLYTDTSTRAAHFGTSHDWSYREAAKWIRRIGVERVVYASNYPVADPAAAKANMEALPLTPAEKRLIMSENYKRLVSKG